MPWRSHRKYLYGSAAGGRKSPRVVLNEAPRAIVVDQVRQRALRPWTHFPSLDRCARRWEHAYQRTDGKYRNQHDSWDVRASRDPAGLSAADFGSQRRWQYTDI